MADSEVPTHYILDVRSVVGNCAVWWRPNGQGYTCNLDDAGLYTFEEASSHRDTDIPIHKDLAESMAIRHVRLDHLRQNGALDKSERNRSEQRKGGKRRSRKVVEHG